MTTIIRAMLLIVAGVYFGPTDGNTRVYKDGDFIIGGLLPIHNRLLSTYAYDHNNICTRLALPHIIAVEAMIYIIDGFNRRTFFKNRKFTVGYDFRDTCIHVPSAMHQAVGFVNDIEKWAALGDEAKKVCDDGQKCFCTFNRTKFELDEIQGRLVNGRPVCSLKDRWKVAPPQTTTAPIGTTTFGGGNFSSNSNETERAKISEKLKLEEPCLNKPILGVVGPSSSSVSAAVAALFALYDIPLVSYFSTRVLLSDPKYSSFFRTIPADDNQARAMAEMIEHFRWNYVSTIASDIEYSREGITTLQKELRAREICLARDEIFNPQSSDAGSQLRRIVANLKQDENVKVVVLFMYWQHAKLILNEASRQNLHRITWIASESWASTIDVLEMEPEIARGIIGVGLPMYYDAAFLSFLHERTIRQSINGNPWLRQYVSERRKWRKRSLPAGIHEKCNFTESGFIANCSEELKLDDLLDENRVLLAPINAANALMVLLTALLKAVGNEGFWKKHQLGLLTHRDLLPYVARTRFRGFGNIQIEFGAGGDLQRAEYEILNVQLNKTTGRLQFVIIGNWTLDEVGRSDLNLTESAIQWNSKDNSVPVSICSDYCPPGEQVLPSPSDCCWACRPCPEGHVSNKSMSTECVLCPNHTYPSDNHTWCRPNDDVTTSQLSPLNIILIFLMSVGYSSLFFILVIIVAFRNLPTIESIQLKFSFVLWTAVGYCYPMLYLFPPGGAVCRLIPIVFQFTFTVHPVILLAQTFQIRRFVERKLLRRCCAPSGAEYLAPVLFTHAVSAVGAVLHVSSTFIDNSGVALFDIPRSRKTLFYCEDPFHPFELIAFFYSLSIVIMAAYFTEKSVQTIGDVTSSQLPYVNGSCYIYLLITATVTPVYFIVTEVNTRIVIISLTLGVTQLTLTGIKFGPKFYIIVMRKLGRATPARKATPTMARCERKPESSCPPTPVSELKERPQMAALSTVASRLAPDRGVSNDSSPQQRPLDRNRLSVRDKYDQELELQIMDDELNELDTS